jgi:hypothetical protein
LNVNFHKENPMRCNFFTVDQVNNLPNWDKKTKSHPKYDWSVSYLALGSIEGLNPELVELAMNICKTQKVSLVNFLVGKPVFGSKNGQVHNRESAIQVADDQFRNKYEAELRAFNSAPIEVYFTRNEMGNIDYGRGEFEGISKLDEVDTAIFEIPEVKTSFKQKQLYHGQFLSWLAQGKAPGQIVRNAANMAKNGSLTWRQFHSIREAAGDIQGILRNREVEQTELNI